VSVSFATPLLVAMTAAAVAAVAQKRLRPEIATQTLAVTCVAAVAAWLWALLALTLGALAAVTTLDRWLSWCPNLYLADDHVPLSVGAVAAVLLAASVGAAVRRFRAAVVDRRRLPECGESGVLVLDCDEPAAFAVPGKRGGVVVSRGLIEALDAGERSVVWAHERAHLRNRHHWYLGAADIAAAALPVLRPLARQVHFGTERWADEDSVRSTGDRRLVARTIAKAALATSDHHHLQMAMASSAVPARVEALIGPSPRVLGTVAGLVVAATLMVFTIGGSTIQLHHLVALVEHVCGGR
jgi:Zn-dependent protease with chaperone function